MRNEETIQKEGNGEFSLDFHNRIQVESGLAVTFAVFVVCKYFCKRMNKETGLDVNIVASL